MNKVTLIEKMQGEFGGTKQHCEDMLEFVLKSIKSEVESGGKVSLGGFGIFSVKSNPARLARNPKTGEKVKVPARRKVRFAPALSFKQLVK